MPKKQDIVANLADEAETHQEAAKKALEEAQDIESRVQLKVVDFSVQWSAAGFGLLGFFIPSFWGGLVYRGVGVVTGWVGFGGVLRESCG